MTEADTAHYATVLESHQVHLVFAFNHRANWGWSVLSGWRADGLLHPEAETNRLLAQQKKWKQRRSIIEDLAANGQQRRRWIDARSWLGGDLSDRLGEAIKQGTAPATIWQREEIVIRGLHAHMPSSIGMHDPTAKEEHRQFAPMYRFRLDHAYVDRINQGEPVIDTTIPATKSGLPAAMRLALPLGRDARARLQLDEPAFIGVRIDDVAVYLSGTRIGQLVFSLTFGPPVSEKADKRPVTAGLVMEALYALSHDPQWRCMEPDDAASSPTAAKPAGGSPALYRLDREGNVPVKAEGAREPDFGRLHAFALRDLAWSLVGPLARQEVRWERAFTYTVAGVAPVVDDGALVRDLALRFARRHNAAYAVADEPIGIETVQPFETACHAAAIEGGAVIVSPRGNAFLKGYVTNTGPGIYLPIALAAHKEFLALLDMSQGAAIPIEHKRYEDATIKRLSRLRDHLYNFRLAHRFSTVSPISMHNAAFDAWRRAFRSEQLLKDVNDDVLSAVTYLREARRDYYERRYGWVAVIVAAGFAFGAASPVFLALLSMVRRNYCQPADQVALLRDLVDAVNQHKGFVAPVTCTLWTPDTWDALAAYLPPLAGLMLAGTVLFLAWHRRERG